MAEVGLTPPVRERLVDVAYARLRQGILNGSLPMGFHLREAHLAADMQISRGPVRLAVQRLVEEGLVTERAHHGAAVRTFDAATLVELYNVRLGLERVAVRLATRVGMDTDGLRSLVRALADAIENEDARSIAELEARFHESICAGSGNGLIADMYGRIAGQIQMAIQLVHAGLPATSKGIAEYEAIVTAIESGDESEAAEAIQTSILAAVESAVLGLGGNTQYLLSRVLASPPE